MVLSPPVVGLQIELDAGGAIFAELTTWE